jgi:hypothetical protein
VTSSIANHLPAGRLAAGAAAIGVKQQLCLRPVPKILWLHRMWVAPQPALCFHRSTFGRCIRSSVFWRLFILVLLVVPRHSGFELVEVNVFTVRQQDLADQPSVRSFILAI